MATLSEILDHALTRLELLESQLFMCPRACPERTEKQLEGLRKIIVRAKTVAEKEERRLTGPEPPSG